MMIKLPPPARILACAVAAAAAWLIPASLNGQQGDVVRVHDPDIIKEGDTYTIFSTGRGVYVRSSNDLKTWERAGRVFEEDVPAWAKDEIEGASSLWAPGIARFNDRFHLYYSVSTFGSQRSAIGLATTKTLDPSSPDFGWTDHGKVVDSVPGRDGFNAIDADVVLDHSGQPWLSWGSFHWGWDRPGGIMILPLDSGTGMPREGAEAKSIAGRPGNGAIEAPKIVRRGEFFYLFVSFDYCCRRLESTYNIRVGRSETVDGDYTDRDGTQMTEGGGTLVLEGDGERIRGPGHNSILVEGDQYWLVHHFYDGNNNGWATLQIRPLTWDKEGWPLAGPPVTD